MKAAGRDASNAKGPSSPDAQPDARPAVPPGGICPLCGRPNGCALAAGRDGASCWCARATFPQELLDKLRALPSPAACACQHCVRNAGGQA